MKSIRCACFVIVATCTSPAAWTTEATPTTTATSLAAPAAAAPAAAAPVANQADAVATKVKDEAVPRVPAGYKVKQVDGETRYCRKSTPLGTRFPTEVCMTEAQYQESVRSQNGLRQELTGKQKTYLNSN